MKKYLIVYILFNVWLLQGQTYGKVSISEVYYDTYLEESNEENIYGFGEFIEFFNSADEAIDMSGWSIRDNSGATYSFPSETIIQPGGFKVLVYRSSTSLTANDFSDLFPNVSASNPDLIFQSIFQLGNKLEILEFYNGEEDLQQRIIYGNWYRCQSLNCDFVTSGINNSNRGVLGQSIISIYKNGFYLSSPNEYHKTEDNYAGIGLNYSLDTVTPFEIPFSVTLMPIEPDQEPDPDIEAEETVLSDENYIYTVVYQNPYLESEIDNAISEDKIESVTYFDGLGRPIQNIAIKQSPSKADIVTPITYDDYGRQEIDYLPYAISSIPGEMQYEAINTQEEYYWQNYASDFSSATAVNAYAKKSFEQSPLNRVLKQAAPGADWALGSGHEIEFDYLANTDTDAVKLFTVNLSISNNTYYPALIDGGNYSSGTLYKTIIKDENNEGTSKLHTTEEFTNKQGQVILKRTYAMVDEAEDAHDTYYVYDDFGNLTYVIPPKVEVTDGVSNTELTELCYQYTYDNRNRLVEKKIPGKGKEYIIYNALDQPVMTQDAKQRLNYEWLFTKYDAFGRVVYTGIYNHGSLKTQAEMQETLETFYITNSSNSLYESKQTTQGSYHYYSSQSFPNTSIELLTVNYYNDYNFNTPTQITLPTVVWETGDITSNTKSLATGSKVKVLDTDTWITTITAYDAKARPIWVGSYNEYLETTDIVKSQLDFVGKVLKTETTHINTYLSEIETVDYFEYDHVGRLVLHKQNINKAGDELILKNHYDELGQLVRKDVGDEELEPLQQIDYTYNVRGWLKKLNNPDIGELGNDLFSFELGYNDMGTGLYNGNISVVNWLTANDEMSRSYEYSYDALNRLKNAYYYEWSKNSRFNVDLSYDKNGNIDALNRQGAVIENPDYNNSSHYGTMDNLSYQYYGNKLLSVTDSGNTNFGFKDGNTLGDDYGYDVNGNMTSDANKGVKSISYNHLNLPVFININDEDDNEGTISYIYDALGNKQLKKVMNSGYSYNTYTNTYYAGNYVYQNTISTPTANCSQCPSVPPSPWEFKFFNHPEGYVEPVDGFDLLKGFNYVYQYKDHLGNVRLSYKENTNAVEQEVWSDGFESATGWDGSGNSWGTAISAFDSSVIRTGSYSGRLDENETNSIATAVHSNHWVNINISEPTYYTLSAWVFLEDVPNNYAGMFLFMNTNGETGYYTEISTTGTTVKGEWVHIEKSVLVQPYIDELNVRIDNMYDGKVWFDDVRILKGNTSRTEILEENNYYPFGLKHKGYNSNPITNHPYKYNGKELNEELGLDWYDLGARNYDASLGRFMNIDPLAEDYNFQSTYGFSINNPILFVDINGEGVLTDYKLLENGEVERIDENDGSENNKNDRLFSTDEHGYVNQNDYVQIDKENAADETVISELSEKKINKFTGQRIRWSVSSGQKGMEDSFKVFKFAAEKSNVEWGLQGFKGGDGSHNYFLGTRHEEGRALSFHDPGTFGLGKDLNVSRTLFKLHSHPRTLGGSSADMRLINTYRKDGLDSSMDLFYIYHIKTKKLVKYNSTNPNVFSKKINNYSDFYTGKYK